MSEMNGSFFGAGPVGPGGQAIPYAVEVVGVPRAEVVICHGLMGDMDEYQYLHLRLSHALARQGCKVHRFDFRGHGSSVVPTRDVTLADMAAELEQVINIASESALPMVLIATSFGALPTLLKLNGGPPESLTGVIFWNPVLDARAVFIDPGTDWSATAFGSLGARVPRTDETFKLDDFTFGSAITMEMQKWNTYPNLSRLRTSCFHGTEDSLVPYASTKRTFDEIFGAAGIWNPIQDVGHGFGDAGDDVLVSTVNATIAMLEAPEQ